MICGVLMRLGTVSGLTSKEWKLFPNTMSSEWIETLRVLLDRGTNSLKTPLTFFEKTEKQPWKYQTSQA